MTRGRWFPPTLIVAAANLILAVIAFVREVVLAAAVGTTHSADAFALSLYLSDVQANTILYNSIVFASIPVFSEYLVNRRDDSMRRTLNSTAGAGLLLSLVLLAVNALAARPLLHLLGADLTDPTRQLAVRMFLLLLPLIPCYVLFGLVCAYLQACSEFTFPSFGPVVLNVLFLAGMAAALRRLGPITLAVSYSLGVVGMLVLQTLPLRARGVRLRPVADPGDPGLRRILATIAPVILVQVLSQPGYVVERMLAGGFGEGGISSLSYGMRVSQIPVWVIVAAIGTVAFPALSRSVHMNSPDTLSRVFERCATLAMAVTLPSGAVFWVFARHVVGVLFVRGAFGQQSLELTSQVLKGSALVPMSYGLVYLLLRVCYATGDTRTAVLSTLIGSAATVITDLLLTPRIGIIALGIGTSIGFGVSAVLTAVRLRRKWLHGLWWRLVKAALHILGCCVIMLSAMLIIKGCLPVHVEGSSDIHTLVCTGVLFLGGFAAYLAAFLVPTPEKASWVLVVEASRGIDRSVSKE
ncbi:MAG: murein biosynthesis integral membrane protein MurJ [Bacillota bacterium]